MGDKYTIKDFLSYFLSGLFLGLTSLFVHKTAILNMIRELGVSVSANSTLIIFISVPSFYLLGHFVQGLDMLIFHSFKKISDFKDKYRIRVKRLGLLWLFKLVSFLLNGHRVTERLKNLNIDNSSFWKSCSLLVVKGKFDKPDYWNVLHLLTEGLVLISVYWCIYFAIFFNWPYLLLFILLAFVFWYRCRLLADNFISSVQNSLAVLENN